MNFLKENIGENIHELGLGEEFIDKIPNSKFIKQNKTKQKMDKLTPN